jgi:rhodanese-related sulfurtransferase
MNVRRRLAVLLCVLLVSAPGGATAEGIRVMTVEQAREAARSNTLILVDVRTPEEWRESGVPDVAVPLDMREKGFVDELMALRRENPGAQLGLICATGGRSGYVSQWLRRNGVEGVVDVAAGMHTREGWLANELPVRPPEQPRRP